MLAAVHEQTWIASQIGKSLGLSYHTVSSYLDYLEGAFLIQRLPPFHANIGKGLIKSPKVYWRDSGLIHALLGVSDRRSLLSQPWVGWSWEGFVIEQILGLISSLGRPHEACFLRTSDRHEIDLLLDVKDERHAIEIKLTTAPAPADMSRLDRVADLAGASHRHLVSQTPRPAGDERRGLVNHGWLLERLRVG